MGYQIIAISPDRPEKLAETLKKSPGPYTLLSDSKLAVSSAFGITFRVSPGMLDRLVEFGIDIEEASGETHHLLPVPSVFVVGKDARIRFQHVNPDYRVRLAPELLVVAARVALKQ